MTSPARYITVWDRPDSIVETLDSAGNRKAVEYKDWLVAEQARIQFPTKIVTNAKGEICLERA